MSKLQKILLLILVLVILVLIILFWGSIASIILASGLIMIVPIYLFNRFINNDEPSDFTENDNG